MVNKLLTKFMEIYPISYEEIECWFPNGKNSIRVRLKGNDDLILTYISKKKWKIESVDSWLDGLRQEVVKNEK
jgi:hypothetical protein